MTERHPLMPADTPDHMASAWASCMKWAGGIGEIVKRFMDETGNVWTLERVEGGDRRAFIDAFLTWANEFIWGRMGATAGVAA